MARMNFGDPRTFGEIMPRPVPDQLDDRVLCRVTPSAHTSGTGEIVGRFRPQVEPEDPIIVDAIEAALNA